MGLRLIDAFPTKAGANGYAKTLRSQGVQFVQVRRVSQDSGRLRWGVYVGGRNSSMY